MLDHAGCMACKKMFETEMPWLNAVLAQHIVRRVLSSGSTPKTIIDMGMGPGYLVKELAAVTNARLIGVDCNPIMLELTQALLAAHAIPNKRVTLCLEDVHHLSFPDRFADVIVSFGCMHHWHDPVVGVKQCMRVLKPSGTLFFIDALPATDAIIQHLEEQIKDQEVLWILKKAALEANANVYADFFVQSRRHVSEHDSIVRRSNTQIQIISTPSYLSNPPEALFFFEVDLEELCAYFSTLAVRHAALLGVSVHIWYDKHSEVATIE